MPSAASPTSGACSCGLCLPEWLADGWRCYGPPPPCPICFEEGAAKAGYTDVANHSWWNSDRCDAHGVCWPCLGRHVETKVLDDGTWHIRCPGPGCRYHLVDEDVRAALRDCARGEEALERRELLRGQSCGARLEELVASAASDQLQASLLRQCQACPHCFALARREDGCPHLVCRCGADYCYGCGAPYDQQFGEVTGCLCGESDDDDDAPLCGLWLFKEKRLPGLAQGSCEAVMLAEIERRGAGRCGPERRWREGGEEEDLVQRVVEFTAVSREQAAARLEEAGWDLEAAIEAILSVFDGESDGD